MLFDISPVFEFLPTQSISADCLEKGDIALLNSRWHVVLSSKLDSEHYNHGYNQIIELFDSGTTYNQPKADIRIIRRDLVNIEKMLKFIDAKLTKRIEQRKLDDEEEKAQMEEETRYLKRRLQELED